MTKHLLPWLLAAAVLGSCASSHPKASVTAAKEDVPLKQEAVLADSLVPADARPLSMMEQPRTEDGAFALYPGFYEADFKSYCLQPGTPDPGKNDAYFQAPLQDNRKEIIQAILRNSQQQAAVEQQNVQVLLWAVVSRTEFNKLTPWVQATGRQLLTQKQIFELNGGTMGLIKQVATMIPSNGSNDVKRLFDLGVNSYEAYERLAVLRKPSTIHRPDFKLNQWYQHPDGYYLRYYPDGYKSTRIQVYVPATSAEKDSSDFVVFDPTTMVIAPANSNAQRLGIGGPVLDVVRGVIKVIERDKRRPRQAPKDSRETHPKTIPLTQE